MTHLSPLHLFKSSQTSKKKRKEKQMIENVAVVIKRAECVRASGYRLISPNQRKSLICVLPTLFFIFFSSSSHRAPNSRGNKESRLPTGPSVCERIKVRPVLTPCASLGKIKPSWGQGQWSCVTPPPCTSRRREGGEAWKRDQLMLFTASLCRDTFKDGKQEIL